MSATCPNCGKPVPASALRGLCPECMLKLGAASQTEAPGQTAHGGAQASPSPPPSPGEIAPFFPQLEIFECLGRGGMGVVYRARQTLLSRLVALKILAPEKEQDRQFAERFMREAQALARLNHPHIVTVYDFGETNGLYFLLMEYVDGMNLRQLLHSRKLVPEEALAIVPPICEALQYAHEQGVVHRDVKPENVLLDKQGRVKIADFGIAKILGQTANQTAITGAKEIVGTPYYMAPEQVEKPTKVDHRADIYSLGVVFYEMLTGELPLGKFAPPSRKAQIDSRLDRVVLHALEKEPERRYQHASQVKTDLETIAHGPPPARPSQARDPDRLPKPVLAGSVPDAATSRKLARRIVFVLVLLMVSWVGLALWLQRPRPVGGVVAADSPDGRYFALAGTRVAMRIFGSDKLFFACSIQGPEVRETWQVPVPFAQLNADYLAHPLTNYSFQTYGTIRWSEDSKRVSFLVRGFEVAAFNVQDRSYSSQEGFLPQRELELEGTRDRLACLIDLDTGLQIVNPGEDVAGSVAPVGPLNRSSPQALMWQQWVRTKGVDFVRRAQSPGLFQIDGASISLGETAGPQAVPRLFDTLSAERVKQVLSGLDHAPAESSKSAQATIFGIQPGNVYAVKTREGGFGLLEILETSPKVGVTRIRYKLVQPSESPPEPGAVQATPLVSTEWSEKLLALNPSGWRQAFALGQQIAALPPDEGYQILNDNWSIITNLDARQQLIKACFFFRGSPPDRLYPRLFDVLDLGMRDRSPGVQGWAIDYLRQLVLRDFADDFSGYDKWYKANAGRPVADTLKDAFAEFLARAHIARPADVATQLELFLRASPWRDLLPNLEASQASELQALLESSARNGTSLALAKSALKAIAQLPPDEAYLRRVVLPIAQSASSTEVQSAALECLGKPQCAWALDFLEQSLQKSVGKTDPSARVLIWTAAGSIARIGESRAIPVLIGVIDADNTYDTVYGVGCFGLGPLTGVTYSETHDGAWWRAWWDNNKIRFPENVRALQIPRIQAARTRAAGSKTGALSSDLTDVPCREFLARGDPQMRFFLIGLKPGQPAPTSGYALLLVLPGGDGSSNFLSFVKRIHKNALSKDYLVAELVAPEWDKQQAETLVWPTETARYPAMKFSTEAFIHAVIGEVEKQQRLDKNRIFTLTWSSSGPAGYAASLYPKTRITASFIAMSVFRPGNLPDLSAARGHAYYLLHSPEDQLIPMSMPTSARDLLSTKGARVELATYEGGHGWHGEDVFGLIRTGITWCEKNSVAEAGLPTKR
jgi:predicted esterase/predicted Ser/Thr protein kinase